MALHFSGNQYEQAYKPKVLRNWEVPKVYNDKPKRRTGKTAIVANDRGHLLPGLPKSKASPWGNFVGTWHLPKKIDRKTAEELSGILKRQTCEEKRRAKEEKQKLSQIQEEPEKVEEVAQETTESRQSPEVVEAAPSEDYKPPEEAPFCPIHGYVD